MGRFDITGVAQFNDGAAQIDPAIPNIHSADGKVDCIRIGDGAGVQCVLYVTWPEQWTTDFMNPRRPPGSPVDGGVPFLGPCAILFGFNPQTLQVRYLMLTTDGIAESETGTLNGNTLQFHFETHCESDTNQRCRKVMGLYIPPEGTHITMTVDIEQWTGSQWADPITRISLDPAPGRSDAQPVVCSPCAMPLTLASKAASRSSSSRAVARQRLSRSTCIRFIGST